MGLGRWFRVRRSVRGENGKGVWGWDWAGVSRGFERVWTGITLNTLIKRKLRYCIEHVL